MFIYFEGILRALPYKTKSSVSKFIWYLYLHTNMAIKTVQ